MSSPKVRSGSRVKTARPRWPEAVLFKVLPLAVIAMVAFTPLGQALALKATHMFGTTVAQVVQQDGSLLSPPPAPTTQAPAVAGSPG